MALKQKTQAEHVTAIRRLAGQDWHAQRIADKLKLARSTVYVYAFHNDIAIKRAPNPYHERLRKVHARIRDLAKTEPGLPRVQIAARTGTNPVTVHRVLKAAGMSTKRQYDADGNLIDRPLENA